MCSNVARGSSNIRIVLPNCTAIFTNDEFRLDFTTGIHTTDNIRLNKI